ncbi:MAG TPA: APC family permease [Candidatus Kapabacteria bacterium]|nr:APC family permease [Candidatus Kapabacteria bacterium]
MTTPASTPTLQRHIGLIALTLYGVGDILGAGIYGLIGRAAGEMGHAIWLAFLVSMIAAGLTGLSYASLGSRFPRAGGAAYISLRAYRKPFISYMVGLAVLASGLTSMATAAKVFGGYLNGLFPALPPLAIALGFSLLIAGIVFRGIRESLFANGIFTLIEVSGLFLIIAAGLPYLGSVNYLDAATPQNLADDISLSLALTGAVLTFYSFVGFEDLLNVAEEVKEPQKTLPRALLLAVLIASLIYMTISLVAVSVLAPAALAGSQQPLVDVAAKIAPWFPSSAFSLIALFAVANTALLNFVMGSRLLYGMASHGLVPRVLSRVHAGRHTPHMAIIAVWVIFVVLVLSGDISSLARATSVLLLCCFVLVNGALVVLKTRESWHGHFDIPVFVPVLGALICLAMLSQAKAPELLTAGAILAGIVVLYFVMRPSADALEHMDD